MNNDIKTGSIFDDIQYRLQRLESLTSYLLDKRIVIYGTGMNAKRILDRIPSIDVIGLMDVKYTGKFMLGKKVLSEEEIQLLKVNIILIAAEPHSAKIVYDRIKGFCIQNNIQIMNMYGYDEFQLHRNILEQELNYHTLSREKLIKQVEENEVILFSFKETLFSELYKEEQIYEIVEERIREKNIYIPSFKRNRILAQKKIPCSRSYSLKDIYMIFSTLVSVSDSELSKIIEIEEEIMLKSLLPRLEMIELVKYAISRNKIVYVCSDLLNNETIVNSAMKKVGVTGYKIILNNCNNSGNLIGRTIKAIGEKIGFEKIIYMGSNKDNNLIISQLYNANIQLIQSSYCMFFEYNQLNLKTEDIEQHIDNEEILNVIFETYHSPFLQNIDTEKCDKKILELIGWQDETDFNLNLELFPLITEQRLENFPKLKFEVKENPEVSIIIPAYNQFSYTYNCLKSILYNTYGVSYEIIVADDCSNDLTQQIEDIVSGITVLHNENNLLFLKNCNNAAKSARGRYLLFLNNDTQVQLNWLSSLIKTIEEDDVGLVGSKLIFPDGRLQEAGGIIWNDASGLNYGRNKNPDSCEYNYVREVDYISGASIMIKKELWNEIGGFDKRFAPAYYEDADLAFEVRKRGKKVIYQPDSIVIHFEGVSNGVNFEAGVKKYQIENQEKMYKKWKNILLKEQYPKGKNILGASDRKGRRKTILFISNNIPTYDKDAGSRTIDFYIKEFVSRGYLVKFIAHNFVPEEPYTHRLCQIGVEVLSSAYYQKNIVKWLYTHCEDLDYAFLNYPDVSIKYVDILKNLGIPIRYYGMDLHYLRNKREYELLGDSEKLNLSKKYYEIELYLNRECDIVYYPSETEVEIVKNEFGTNNAKQLIINIYDIEKMKTEYLPEEREGIMFIGGYKHTPNVDAVLWFVYNIFPQIYEVEKMNFYIVGVDMPTEIRNIKMPGVVILGALTDSELKELYQKIKMVVAPLRYGAGIKGKIIEAMYYGIPIVTTSIGAEGIPNEGNSLTIADEESDFVNGVLKLYKDTNKLLNFSNIYKDIIIKYFSREAVWNNICDDFI